MTSLMEDTKDSLPDFYPDDLVLPPEDSVETNGTFYRLVKTVPPSANCFRSTHEDQPRKHLRCTSIEEKEAVYGTTFWSNRDSLARLKDTLAEAFKDRIMVSGVLAPTMGMMKKTLEEYHYTVWLKKNSNVHTVFDEVKE